MSRAERSTRLVRYALAVGPAAIIFWIAAMVTLNHFQDGPFLQDSGWHSAIVYRNGILPVNPEIAGSVPKQVVSFYGVHFSPIVSIASLASYLFPVDRVDWFCLFLGAIFAPLGALPAVLMGKSATKTTGLAILTFVVGLAFGLNGQAIACLGYPHFEILIPVGIALCLTGLATGREKLAWIGIATALATREDGGLHVTLFLAAAFASDLFGAPFAIPRRRIVVMAVVAFAGAIVSVVIQKKGFVGANLFREEYLGEPPLAHITLSGLPSRLSRFVEHAGFIVFAFVATAVFAAVRRDARYLLGWVAGLPWFLLNLFAAQPNKAEFTIYTGFPFVASIFWVAAYARIALRRGPPHHALGALGVVSLASTLGLQYSYGWALPHFARYSLPPTTDHGVLVDVARTMRADPRVYGRLYLDGGMVSWTIESAPVGSWIPQWRPGVPIDDRDGIAFFRSSYLAWGFLQGHAHSHYDRCGRLRGNNVYLCTTADRSLPDPWMPASPLLDILGLGEAGVRATTAGHIAIDAAAPGANGLLQVWGPFVRLSPGAYRAKWTVVMPECGADGAAPHLDVYTHPGNEHGQAAVTASSVVEIPFDVGDADQEKGYELRAWAGRCAYEITDLRLIAVSAR